MASSASTSMASVEPAVNTNSTGGDNAKSSAVASPNLTDATEPIVLPTTVETITVTVIYYKGYRYMPSSKSGTLYYWKCDSPRCPALLRTRYINGQHLYESADAHWEEAHKPRSGGGAPTASTPRADGKRKAVSRANKPLATVSGDAQVPAKKSKDSLLPIGGAVMANHTLQKQGKPPGKAEDAAGDNSKRESTKGSGASNLVDSRAAAVRPSPIHVQHPRGSNEPGTSALPSGDQGVQGSEIIPPPIPPAGTNPADTAQNDADYGDESSILSDDSINGDWEADGRGSPDPPPQNASYESPSNAGNAADDSAGIPLSMHGLGERELREMCLRQKLDLSAKQLEIEDLRAKLLNWELCSNRAGKLN